MEERQMHKATCSDCKQECEVPFKPTEGKPVRCSDCFKKARPQRNNFRNNNRRFDNKSRFSNNRPREMHKANCSDCGKPCEVPFKPTEGKPVRCKDCFSASRN